MGQRLAPTLAIAFMSKIERPVLESRPLLYCRYVDDCFVICSTQTEMDRCFELLNEQSEFIKLSREIPEGDWLPFLNVQIRLTRGVQVTKWYRKATSKNILVHCQSAHPTKLKRSVLRNMFRTAVEVCSGEDEKKESLELARQIAKSNGYTNGDFKRRRRCTSMNQQDAAFSISEKVPFCVPFISDEVTAVIRQCLRKSRLDDKIAIIEIPPNNLKRMLIRNRMYDRLCAMSDCKICPNGTQGDCMCAGVVYLITCKECNEEYIGETARPLCLRIKEHLDGKIKQRRSTVLGMHRETKHGGADFDVSVTIIAHETNTVARKSLEAFLINVKSPKMNRKGECLSITNELLPYLRIIF